MYILGTSAPLHHWAYLIKNRGIMLKRKQMFRHICNNNSCCNVQHFETGSHRVLQLRS